MTTWIGLDIGGANLKAATSSGQFASMQFPMWRKHQELGGQLEELVRQLDTSKGNDWPQSFSQEVRVAAVMTGELADSFASKAEGVAHIVDCVTALCDRLGFGPPIFGGVRSGFCGDSVAKREPLKVAAANWYFLAMYISRAMESGGCVVDMGSTTTDIIPVNFDSVGALGKTDVQRLKFGELVYAGVGRTPICGLLDCVKIGERSIPIANELFASIKDALVVAGELAEDPRDLDTADGRPRVVDKCRHRLARCVCADAAELDDGVVEAIAAQAIARLEELVKDGLTRVSKFGFREPVFAVTGAGATFATKVIKRLYPDGLFVELDNLFPTPGLIDVAPAFAVARMAAETIGE